MSPKAFIAFFVLVALALITAGEQASATADGPDFFKVRGIRKGGFVALRSEPADGATTKGRLPYSASGIANLGCVQVERGVILDDTDVKIGVMWCRVDWRGVTGWAKAQYLAEM